MTNSKPKKKETPLDGKTAKLVKQVEAEKAAHARNEEQFNRTCELI